MIYKDFELSKNQLKVLKYLSEYPNSDLKQFNKLDIDFLVESKFLRENTQRVFFNPKKVAPYFYLTDISKMYLSFKSRKRKEFWIPIAISVIALIKSFQSEICVILELLLKR